MKRNIFIILLTLVLLLAACGQRNPVSIQEPESASVEEAAPETEAAPASESEATEEPEVQTITVIDDLGVSLTFESYPQAIVSISPSTTEILFAIGAGSQVIGRDEMSMFPEEAMSVTSVGALWGDLPTEAILALEPDLIVAAQVISEDQVQALRDLGLNVYWQANPTSYEDLWGNLRDIGVLTGHQDETETLIANLEARVSTVEEKVSSAETTQSVFYELDATDPSAPWTAGSGTFIDYIISFAGGTNIAASLEGDYPQISAEALIEMNPDVILLADALYGVTPEVVAARPGWDVITAVSSGALYPIDPNLMSVPGPRLVDALEETARLLHPELFK